MSGVDVCREIRRTSTTPVIVLSVVGDEKAKVAPKGPKKAAPKAAAAEAGEVTGLRHALLPLTPV